MLSKTNSLTIGKYTFQPTKYDKDGNLYWALYRKNSHGKKVCKVTGIYYFDEERTEIIFRDWNWLNKKHKKLLEYFLKQYDWS